MNYSVGEAISLVNKIIVNDVALDDFLTLMDMYKKGLMNKKQIYSKFCLLFHGHSDILEELQRLTSVEEQQVQNKAEQQLKLHKEQRACAVFAATDPFRKRVRDERKKDHDQGANTDFQTGVCYSEGIKVFNKVREKLCNFQEYGRFLKLLHMYSKGKINGGELETMVAELLQMDTDLIMEFVEFRRLCKRNFDHGSVAWGARKGAQELEEEKVLKQGRKTEKTRAEGGEKRAKETIFNGFNPKRCTPSYRPRLMDEFPAPNVVASTTEDAQILNDYWVCESCPGTRSSTKPKKEIVSKDPENKYEDERYELDMDLASLKSTIDNAEKLQNHIQGIGDELLDLETPIRLENYFTASNIKLLGDKHYGIELRTRERLRRKPDVALPVVLAHLNQKKEEALKAIRGMRVRL